MRKLTKHEVKLIVGYVLLTVIAIVRVLLTA